MKVFNEGKTTSFVFNKKDIKQIEYLLENKSMYFSKKDFFTFKKIIIENGKTVILK